MISLNRIGTSFLLFIPLLAAPSSPAQAQAGAVSSFAGETATAANNSGTFSSCGTPACNGTSAPAEVTVSTTSTVQVAVGGGTSVTASISQANQASFTQELEPGECIKIKYDFECTKGWFFWSCELSSISVV